jgi:hypothetical protein
MVFSLVYRQALTTQATLPLKNKIIEDARAVWEAPTVRHHFHEEPAQAPLARTGLVAYSHPSCCKIALHVLHVCFAAIKLHLSQ